MLLQRFSMQPDPSFATAWFTPEQIGVWNWERLKSPEFGELHKKAMVENDDAERGTHVQADAGPDGGIGRLRLPHPRGERGALPRRFGPGLRPDGNRALRRVQAVAKA